MRGRGAALTLDQAIAYARRVLDIAMAYENPSGSHWS